MQIYELKLGESAEPDKTFTLDQLELQLGMALNRKCPVLGQAFTHPFNLGRDGRTWLLPEYIEVPTDFSRSGDSIHHLCQIKFDALNQASFLGTSCSLSRISKVWKQASASLHEHPAKKDHSVQQIYLDWMRYGYSDIVPESLKSTKPAEDARQHELCDFLDACFEGTLSVLLVGKIVASYDEKSERKGRWLGLFH